LVDIHDADVVASRLRAARRGAGPFFGLDQRKTQRKTQKRKRLAYITTQFFSTPNQ